MKKRLFSLVLASVMALSMVACGSGAASETDATATVDENSTETTTASADATVYNVGVLQLVEHPALDAATQGFQDALKEKLGDNVNITVQNASGDSATCATIANQYVSEGVDLIMANATAALQSACAATNTIPVLGTSITDYGTALSMSEWTGTTGINVSGTSDLAPLDKQAEMLNEIFPDVKTVGILYCTAEANSKYQADVITGYLSDYGYEVKEFTFNDTNDVASVTTSACSECEVLYIPTDNTAASCTEAIQNVALPAGIPIIAGEEGICSGCGVATLSISYYDLGYETGLMAYEVLAEGADPATMDIRFAPAVTKKYNAANCDELAVTVPDGYEAIAE
ncbi:MAG: ABC transporter substrate-binding protein [Pseudobutyrivibrio sp.]|nr:ABC transporter substrate-binding protein [Pseudobutyrivibrio sp.]